MRNDTPAASGNRRHEQCASDSTRQASAQQEAPALLAARRQLWKVARDLRRNRQDLAALARGLRTIEATHRSGFTYPHGTDLGVEEWAADCADAVADGLVGLAEVAESYARADWHEDLRAWLDTVS